MKYCIYCIYYRIDKIYTTYQILVDLTKFLLFNKKNITKQSSIILEKQYDLFLTYAFFSVFKTF